MCKNKNFIMDYKPCPDFNNIELILKGKCPGRPTLFEFFHNYKLYEDILNIDNFKVNNEFEKKVLTIKAFEKLGYDYVTLRVSNFSFSTNEIKSKATVSQSDYNTIIDRKSFDEYSWPESKNAAYSELNSIEKYLPKGMKVIICGPGGVLENVIMLVGFERLCYMKTENPELVSDIFQNVGSRLAEFYRYAAKHRCVGALISNDDWGFNIQTMLSTKDMRKFVFPWHKKIVENIHASGKPAILHSCGNLKKVMKDVVDDMKYDGKHSYEDKILPVEEAYEQYKDKIAILGGIDLDFICRATTEEIYTRSKLMLERVQGRGAYALGTGNSVPEYAPNENFYALIKAALDQR